MQYEYETGKEIDYRMSDSPYVDSSEEDPPKENEEQKKENKEQKQEHKEQKREHKRKFKDEYEQSEELDKELE